MGPYVKADFKDLINMRKKNKTIIGIIGLGYVGLPLLLLTNKKFKVYGFDIDKKKLSNFKTINLIFLTYPIKK